MTLRTMEELATEVAGRKHPCTACDAAKVITFSKAPTLCCAGTGQAYIFPDEVRVPCSEDDGTTCFRSGRLWVGSQDLQTWIKATWQVFPTKVVMFTPPGQMPPQLDVGQIDVVGDEPLYGLLRGIEQAVTRGDLKREDADATTV